MRIFYDDLVEAKNGFRIEYEKKQELRAMRRMHGSLPGTEGSGRQGGNAEEAIFVGLLGNYNTGKTYFLSQLLKKQLPSGFDTHTQGFSLVFGENGLYFIDTAGMNEPLPLYSH